MIRPRVIPCLLLRNEGLVKTVKFKDPKYLGDPINIVRIFNDKEVDELIFLDITATVENRPPNFEILGKITSECFMPLGYGGGIRTLEEVRKLLAIGVEKIVLNTSAVENPSLIRAAAEYAGSQAVVISMDVKKTLFGKYEVYTRGGRKATGLDPVKYAVETQKQGAGELFLNSIDRDGTLEGYDLDLIHEVSQAVAIPVVAAGGCGSYEHVAQAIKAGAHAVAVGAMFQFTEQTPRGASRYLNDHGIPAR